MFGDIIYVERRPMYFGSIDMRKNEDSGWIDKFIFRFARYRHYGIEVENGNVIHFHSTAYHKRKQATIKKVPMDVFLLGGSKSILELPKNVRLSREETVDRAYSALGVSPMAYSVNRNNCEHFAMWCSTGVYHSKQSYYLSKGHDVLLLPTKVPSQVKKVVPYTMNHVVPATIRTKDRTIRFSVSLYKRLLKRA